MELDVTWKDAEIIGPSPRGAHKEQFRFAAVVPPNFKELKERGGPYWAVMVTPPGGESITVVDNEGTVYLFTKIVGVERYRLDAEIERVPNEMGHPFPGVAMTLRGVAGRGRPKMLTEFTLDGGGIGVQITLTR